jgi:RNA polymerase sigma-70 factor (ECF subfamily)
MVPAEPAARPASNDGFAATRWTLVAAAGAQEPASARRALIELCLRYWFPVYSYVRGCGHTPEVAQDISRSFFEDLLQRRLSLEDMRGRGRFREFILSELSRFLARDWRQPSEQPPVPEFDHPHDVGQLEARHQRGMGAGLSLEQNYQRSYALEVLGGALARLRREADQAGHLTMFEVMEPFLSVDPAPGQFEELARELKIRPLATVVALKRLRQRFRELADAELAETVASAADLEAERRALAAALGVP